jgi:hypothetical protein
MGLDINAVRYLIGARKRGVDFGRVLTIGRQDLNVYPSKMVRVLRKHGLATASFERAGPDTRFADPFFASLGAGEIHSLDASGFEGANVVHDLNCPIGPELHSRYGVVYDGGTLEHIFQFPIALKNCMEMVKPGGRLFLHTVANNWCGHGFYQFSPELFFRAFSSAQGFEIVQMILHRVGPYGKWYEVSDPEETQSRVELVTFSPVHLLVEARRVEVKPIFEQPLQQSDYTPRWEETSSLKPSESDAGEKKVIYEPSRPPLARLLPNLARLFHVLRMGAALYWNQSLRNRRSFRPVKKP